MDDTPYVNDGADASLRKAVSLLNKIDAKTGAGGGSSGGLTNAELRATPVPVDIGGSGSITITSGTVTVSNEVEVTNNSGNPIPVSGTVTANTGLSQPLTDTQLRATAVPVSGPLTDTQLRATAVPVSGTFWQATQPISGSVTADIPAVGSAYDSMAPFDSANTGIVSLIKRLSTHLAVLRDELGGGTNAISGFNSIGSRSDSAPSNANDSGSLIAFTKRLNSAIDSIFGSTYLSLNNSQATFRISHPYGTLGIASPSYIVSANTAQLVFSAKSTSSPRRFLLLQNTSDTPMYVGFGTGLYAKPAASGSVNAVTITNGGSGYVTAPSVSFSPPPAGGTTAAGTAVISGGVVTSVVITNCGSGYASAPSIIFGPSPNTSATANAIIGPTGLYLAPVPGTLSFDRGFIPNDAIYLTCASAGKSFVAIQA